jgi:hypothetical protein
LSFDANIIRVSLDIDESFEEALRQTTKDSINEVIQQFSPETQQSSTGITGGEIASLAGRGMTGGASGAIGMLMPMIPHLVPIMIAAGVAKTLFDWAVGAGGPLDVRYRRELSREANSFLSRQLQHDTGIGLRQVIIGANANFKNTGGAGNSNSLRQVRTYADRQANAGLLVTDKASGLERIQ